MAKKCCGTCGNSRCADNIVAIYYDECIAHDYVRWMPKWTCIGKFSSVETGYRVYEGVETDSGVYEVKVEDDT